MKRRTKIVATIGPATDHAGGLDKLIEAGVDVVRINFSHATHDQHRQRVAAMRVAASKAQRNVAILADLQGPKIRIEGFADGQVQLIEGASFTLDTSLDAKSGTAERVGISYRQLLDDVAAGDVLLLNDGAIRLEVSEVAPPCVHCVVINGGLLSDRKGINRLGGGLSAEALTDKDREDVQLAAELAVDFVAVSFPGCADDMHAARALCDSAGLKAGLIAKIERAEALNALEELICASDGVMVARGDLGVEIGDAELPGVQKQLISMARDLNRVVITATQMMESMISSPIPTRAEVLDVANAVMDGTDAVMLSAETAAGQYPVKAVEAMHRVCVGAEKQQVTARASADEDDHFTETDEAIAMATMYTAKHMHANAILALTESGSTALMMSRQDTRIPIYAMTRWDATLRKMCLCRGVYPIPFDPDHLESSTKPVQDAVACLQSRGLIEPSDRLLATKGDFDGPGGTNTMKIVHVPG